MNEPFANHSLNRLVNVKHLKPCKLWEGSNFQTDFQYGGVKLGYVIREVQRLNRCTDRTEAEDEWLAALQATLAEMA